MHWRSFCIGTLVPGEQGAKWGYRSCAGELGLDCCSHFCRAIPFFSKAAVLPFYLCDFLGRHILTKFTAVCNAAVLFEK